MIFTYRGNWREDWLKVKNEELLKISKNEDVPKISKNHPTEFVVVESTLPSQYTRILEKGSHCSVGHASDRVKGKSIRALILLFPCLDEV